MRKLELIDGGRIQEKVDNREDSFRVFVDKFMATLKARGVLNDFSLRKVVEEAQNGKSDFEGHERDVYDTIKDLLEYPNPSPTPKEGVMPLPDEEIKRAA